MASQPNQIAAIDQAASPEAQKFALMQRQASLFASSPLIPQHLRQGTPQQAMANCYIAMTIADRMGEDRMTVMQNIHIVHGTAGFKAQYMIARANASGVFKDGIDWEIAGEGNALSVTAFATLAKTGRRVEITVDMAMAIAEGWSKNSKYKTMPEIMLRYRSATFLVRMYAPQVMLGYHTTDEVEDVAYAGGMLVADDAPTPLTAAMIEDQSADPETGEISEGPDQSQQGEITTLESAKSEIDRAEIIADVNSRVAALSPLLSDDDADALRAHAMDRIDQLKAPK